MFYVFIWIALSVLVGIAGSSRTIGFIGSFLLSIFFSPLVGVIGVALSSRNAKEEPKPYETEIERKARKYDQMN